MESQDFNKTLIEYLYGEMSATEKKEFEEKLATDPALKNEYEELRSVRDDLSKLEDKEVMEPFSIWAHTKSGWMNAKNQKRSIMLKPITAIAASLIILMLVGFATDFSLKIDGDGFQMGFQKSEQPATHPSITEDDVKRILAQEIEKNNEQILTNMNEKNSSLVARLAHLENENGTSKKSDNQNIYSEDLNQFYVNMQDRNARLLQDYLNQASRQQQDYFKTMLTQFNEYLQDQRAEDLNIIQSEFIEMKQSQTQQKRETEQVLADLISTVSQRQN